MYRIPSHGAARSRVAAAVLGACLALAPALGAAQSPEPRTDLAALLELARRNSPELNAMRLEADAAQQRIRPAGALPDPALRVELMNINNYGSDARPSLLPSKVGETRYTVMQGLPAWGKRGLKEQVAVADAALAQAQAAATWNELAARIKTAYAQYHLAWGNERLAREVLDLMVRLEQVAQARYAGGLVPQQDAIQAQIEQTAMRSELIALDNEKAQLRARLNALLARDAATPLGDAPSLRTLPPASTLDAQALMQRASAGSPVLQAEQARVQGAEKNRDLTWRNRYPDVNVGISPTQMGSRITAWGVMVEVNIPLQQSTRRAQESEAAAMLAAARSRAEAAAHRLRGELAEQLAALQAAQREEALVRSQLLPQSELSFRSALAAYENGKADFATLLDAQRQIRKARQGLLKAQVEAQLRLADIERTVGDDL